MLDLTPAEAAAALAVCRAQCEGRVIDAVALPLELGTAMVKLARVASGAQPTVSRSGAAEGVLDGLSGNCSRSRRANDA